MKESKRQAAPRGSVVTGDLPMRAEALLAAVLRAIAVRDREKFTEDLGEIFYAKSEAHGLRAFWELVVRWERFYPSVVQTLERQLGGAFDSV
ncbi:MAG: hypothetical protein ABFS46_10255 [Myxococcota bacterium]